jgi:Flp pilus assembly protein TadG
MNFYLHHTPLRRLRRTLHAERGAAMIEFALVLPLLALILFGVLDFGKAYNYWISETHLASEGARYAAVDQNPDPSTYSNFLGAVRSQADTAELRNGGTSSVPNPLRVCVTFPDGTHNVGDPVKVQVTSTYQFLSLFGGGLSKTVVADSTMRLERVPTKYADGDCA